MKQLVQIFVVLALSALVIYQSFFQRQALHEAKELTHQLTSHLDTLQVISRRYEESHRQYVALHKRLLHTQQRAVHLRSELTMLASNQEAELQDIHHELQKLLAQDRAFLLQPASSIDPTKATQRWYSQESIHISS